jgi:hypothetical protein
MQDQEDRRDYSILYRTKTTDGITQGGQTGLYSIVYRTKRRDRIRQNPEDRQEQQDRQDHTRLAEHEGFDRIKGQMG